MAPRKVNSQRPTPARILLVDDHASGLGARKCVLEEMGHRISTASSGAEALEALGRQKFDLLVTDFKMPRMNGVELIGEVRKRGLDLPAILISGFVEALGMNEANTGADAVIQKSANEISHLVRGVSRLLRRKPVKRAGPELANVKKKAV